MFAPLRRHAARIVRALAVLALLSVVQSPAQAVIIELTPASSAIEVGATVDLDIMVSDLGEDGFISTFDLRILFDDSLLGFAGGSITDLLGNDLDFTALTGIGAGDGVVDLFAISFLSEADLAAAQGSSFSLARLSFTALGAGSSLVSFDEQLTNLVGACTWNELEVQYCPSLGIDRAGSASVSATEPPVSVPEPSMPALLAVGLVLLAVSRRMPAARIAPRSSLFGRH